MARGPNKPRTPACIPVRANKDRVYFTFDFAWAYRKKFETKMPTNGHKFLHVFDRTGNACRLGLAMDEYVLNFTIDAGFGTRMLSLH